MWYVLITIATIALIIILLYGGPRLSKVRVGQFSFRRIPWKGFFGLILTAYIGYLGWYYLYGRESVLVTHYVVAGVDGTCIEANAINGETESFTMRRWESYTFSVPPESRRCYSPLSRLQFKTRNHRRVHIVSLR